MCTPPALYYTQSVCPVCLQTVTAAVRDGGDGIYMDKTCPEHGPFSTLIWGDTAENYLHWLQLGGVKTDTLPQSPQEAERALPAANFAACCQLPVTSALMTTNRCNMDCPVCFTRDKGEALHQPSLDACRTLITAYRQHTGEDALLELCGGEPTIRPDIMELAAMAREIGFDFIQLNTNGIKLAQSAAFCHALKENGVTTVYLGFDGMSEKPYLAKYGKPMLEVKKAAVKNCAAANLAVVLVTCVIPGENDGQLGEIIAFAKENMPTVKGVYLQPISYFGIYPKDDIRRITIPDIMRALADQCPEIDEGDFSPGAYEHPQCAFQACYMLGRNGKLSALTKRSPRREDPNALHRVRASMRATWLPSGRNMLTVGGMAFQDAWNIDVLRTRQCSIQIMQKDGALVSLCGKYLSGCDGSRLLPGIG